MTKDHVFVDRKGEIDKGKEIMIKGWIDFFKAFPEYKNTFTRVQSQGELVILYGYATWQIGATPDYVIWTARVENDLVAEWRIYEDSQENKKQFNMT